MDDVLAVLQAQRQLAEDHIKDFGPNERLGQRIERLREQESCRKQVLERRRLRAGYGARQEKVAELVTYLDAVTPRTAPRARGAGRPKAQATRSSARSGDSGEGEQSDPEKPCACGCGEDISHRAPQAKYLNNQHADAHRQRRKRDRERDWSPDVSRRDPYLRFDVPTFEQLRQRIEQGCRCNGHHIANAEDGHCIKCGHRHGWSMPIGYTIAAQSAETRRSREAIA